jgi:hypothetical protein
MCVFGDNKMVILFDFGMVVTISTVNFIVRGACQLSERC